ncbi:hypothetical protein [Devosia sp. A449]
MIRSVGRNIRLGERSLKKSGVQYLFTHNKSPGGKQLPARVKQSTVKCLRQTVAAWRWRTTGRRGQ